jgi:hypothetical protein
MQHILNVCTIIFALGVAGCSQFQARKALPARLAPPALQDRSALPDLKDRKDPKVPSERKAQPATGVRPARPARRDRSAPKVHKANRELKDQRVLPASAANPGRKALPDRRVPPDHLDPKVTPAPRQRSVSLPGRDQCGVARTSCWSRSSAPAVRSTEPSARRPTRPRQDCASASNPHRE